MINRFSLYLLWTILRHITYTMYDPGHVYGHLACTCMPDAICENIGDDLSCIPMSLLAAGTSSNVGFNYPWFIQLHRGGFCTLVLDYSSIALQMWVILLLSIIIIASEVVFYDLCPLECSYRWPQHAALMYSCYSCNVLLYIAVVVQCVGEGVDVKRNGVVFPVDPVFSEAVQISFSFLHKSLLHLEKNASEVQPRGYVCPSEIEFGTFSGGEECENSYYVDINRKTSNIGNPSHQENGKVL